MSNLILVRHSVPEQQLEVAASQWRLSKEGRERCQQLAQSLALKYTPTAIAASPEPKALETASIIASYFGLPVEVTEGLHEHDRRNIGYLPTKEFKAGMAEFYAHPDELVLGTETARQALVRFSQAIEGLIKRKSKGDLLVVTHGTVMTLFLAHYNPQLNPFDFWQQLPLPVAYSVALANFQLRNEE